jgi:hypothetical protein
MGRLVFVMQNLLSTCDALTRACRAELCSHLARHGLQASRSPHNATCAKAKIQVYPGVGSTNARPVLQSVGALTAAHKAAFCPLVSASPRRRHPTGYVRASQGRSYND